MPDDQQNTETAPVTALTFCQHQPLMARLNALEEAGEPDPMSVLRCDACGESFTVASAAMIRVGVGDLERDLGQAGAALP
jgi:hypothetical protein